MNTDIRTRMCFLAIAMPRFNFIALTCKGISFAKAKALSVKQLNGEFDEKLTLLPNNILGVEYTRAILERNSKMKICPMIRLGDHNDTTLKKGVTSATSIREVLKTGKIKKLKGNLPKYVYSKLIDSIYCCNVGLADWIC